MGLSRMSDEMPYDDGYVHRTRTFKALYQHRGYIDPIYGEWGTWYAWHPIYKIRWVWVPEVGSYFKLARWEWCKDLLRRRVTSRKNHLTDARHSYWEYTTMEELLRYA